MTDFDFLFGRWKVHNTRLAERLVGSSTWIEFDAVSECRPILGGIGNVDEMVTSWNGRYRGMSLRLFDLERKTWSIYWSSSLTGVLDPPVTGTFADNIGTFVGRDSHAGTPVLARFVWSQITPTSARWEQAFSTNEGVDWEMNWWMQFERS
jgi:hypothetical protein